MLKQALLLAEKGLLPDSLIRFGIRQLLKKRLDEISHQDTETSQDLKSIFLKSMDQSPIALVPHLANKQHYEVPSSFFDFCLGKHKKYSSCYWDSKTNYFRTWLWLGLINAFYGKKISEKSNICSI
jgi:cyclopropane-fatty-acyl-phospholipid synthase